MRRRTNVQEERDRGVLTCVKMKRIVIGEDEYESIVIDLVNHILKEMFFLLHSSRTFHV